MCGLFRITKLAYSDFYVNQQMVRFLGVGLLNTIFGYGIYAVLIAIKIPYPVALFITTVAGVTFNYFSTGRLVFKLKGDLKIFVKFIASYSIGYFVNVVALAFMINHLETGPYWGQALCMPPSIVLSWLMLNYWVFKRRSI